MIIQPGVSSPSIIDSIELVRTNSKRRIDVFIYDSSGAKVDIDETVSEGGTSSKGLLTLEVTDMSDALLYSESYTPVVLPDTRRIKRLSVGHYYIEWGAVASETSTAGTYLFNWTARVDADSEESFRTQVVEVISPRTLSLFPRLRLQLDKSLKLVKEECFYNLGFTDAQLLLYLKAACEFISQAQPYPTWLSLDAFPIAHGAELLISCAVKTALESQYLLAVDTDIPSFSDQGHSFVITKSAQLKSLYDSLSTSLPLRIREFKLHYVRSGTASIEFRIGYGFWQMVNSSPPGSTFRGHYTNTMGMN